MNYDKEFKNMISELFLSGRKALAGSESQLLAKACIGANVSRTSLKKRIATEIFITPTLLNN